MRQLHGLDLSFLALETPQSPMHIGCLSIYDPSGAAGGIVRFEELVSFIESRLHLSATVRRRLVKVPLNLDFPYWVEDERFDLRDHVRHVTLPAPGGWDELCSWSAEIFSRPLDLDRPPWEMTMIEGLGDIPGVPTGSYALLAKVHHAAIDGLAGIDLLQALHSASPASEAPPQSDPWRPEPVPATFELVARSWLNRIRHPARSVQLVRKAAPAVARVLKGAANEEFAIDLDTPVPPTRFNGAVSRHRVVGACRLPLGEVRAIRALAPGCKLNDVFLAIVGGALHHYLGALDELPDQPLTALVPISVRGKRERGDTGNQITAMIVPLGSDLADPTERLHFVQRRTRNSKAASDAIGARTLMEMSDHSPALFLALGAQLFARRGRDPGKSPLFNTLVTNVPGPKVPLYSAGARLENMMGLMCLTDGMGLAHVVQSYLDEATVAFTADRAMMADPEFYAACIERSFTELLEAAKALPEGGPRKQSRKRAGAAAKT